MVALQGARGFLSRHVSVDSDAEQGALQEASGPDMAPSGDEPVGRRAVGSADPREAARPSEVTTWRPNRPRWPRGLSKPRTLNDAAMVRLADLLAERHGMDPELRERRWSSIATVQDLLELVRTLER